MSCPEGVKTNGYIWVCGTLAGVSTSCWSSFVYVSMLIPPPHKRCIIHDGEVNMRHLGVKSKWAQYHVHLNISLPKGHLRGCEDFLSLALVIATSSFPLRRDLS